MRISKYAIVLTTAVTTGIVFAAHFQKPSPTNGYHVVSYIVPPNGVSGQRIGEQWIQSDRQRITNYPFDGPGPARGDYLLEERGSQENVTVRSRNGSVLTLTKSQAINGTQGGKWAQASQITPLDSDFSKLEHFWRSAVVEHLPQTTASSFGKTYKVNPVQITENGFYRVTGYLDATTGRLLREESYSLANNRWILTDYAEFEYSPVPKLAFDPQSLSPTQQFELAKRGRESKERVAPLLP